MKEVMMLVVVMVGLAVGQTTNYSGLLDTAVVTGFTGTTNTSWTKGFPLSQKEDVRVIVKTRGDTSNAGWLTDSMAFQWGYLTYSLCMDTSLSVRKPDTCRDLAIVVDTLDSLSLTRWGTYGSMASDGEITRNNRVADTVGCSGYAVQSRWILPEWDSYIRFWCKGIGKNKLGASVPVVFELKRREFVNVRMK